MLFPNYRKIIPVSKEKAIPSVCRKTHPVTHIHCFLYSIAVFRARPVSDSDMTQSVTEVPGGGGGGGRGGGGGGEVLLVMGGREVGQVNMFQRNISLWKLAL